jgi:hypothetical protein
MVAAVTASGTAEAVRQRIAAFEGRADTVKLSPPTHGVDASITRLCQERIIELIATL